MKKILFLIPALTVLLLFSCGEDDGGTGQPNDWLIPLSEVFDGGPGKDGIPSVDAPSFRTIEETTYMQDDDLVVGIKIGDEIRAYTHPILDWHEIVNDEFGGMAFGLTYCPLTGTGIAWNGTINGQKTTYGVSGLLYNSNLIPYDRNSDSNWSQFGLLCVNGSLSGQAPETIPLIETSWATWKQRFPGTQILSTATGFARNYEQYPYGDFKESEDLIFPVSPDDRRIHRKERVMGVVDKGNAKAYRFSSFEYDSLGIGFIQDSFEGQDLLLVGSEEENYILAFNVTGQGNYSSLNNSSNGAVFTDDAGNEYSMFGEVLAGSGADLEIANAFMGYWFGWGAFYPNLPIHGE